MITLIISTGRPKARLDWAFDSLLRCSRREIISQIVIVDLFAEPFDDWTQPQVELRREEVFRCAAKFLATVKCELNWIPPKPNAWSGKFRFTPRNWWSKPESINAGVCVAKHDYLVFSDDRCVFLPTFLDAVQEAKDGNYAVCGTYEKGHNVVVEDGVIKSYTEPKNEHGKPTGKDGRADVAQGRKMICPGAWMFGHAFGLPLEWMLQVNGVSELWDSVGMEDTHFGQMLDNNGFAIYHDPRMAQLQDRTPGQCDYDMKRDSKEKHPNDKNDKTHKLIEMLWKNKQSANSYILRDLRKHALAGNPFPVPLGPHEDWFDGQRLKDMT